MKRKKRQPRWLNRKEQDDLLQVVKKDLYPPHPVFTKRQITRRRNAAFVVFMLYTGLRVSELLNLRLEDLKAEERSIRAGKGHKERTIPLNATACKALAAWLQVRPNSPIDFVFVTLQRQYHAPLSLRGVEQFVAYYGRLAGLQRLTPSMLRHTFAKNLVDAGVGLSQVAAMMGQRLDTALIYFSPDFVDLRQAAEALVED